MLLAFRQGVTLGCVPIALPHLVGIGRHIVGGVDLLCLGRLHTKGLSPRWISCGGYLVAFPHYRAAAFGLRLLILLLHDRAA